MVRDRSVDAIAIERRAPLHAALVAAGADEGVPDERAGLRIEEDVDAALLAEPDDVTRASVDPVTRVFVHVTLVSVHPQPHDVDPRTAKVPFLAVRLRRAPRHH